MRVRLDWFFTGWAVVALVWFATACSVEGGREPPPLSLTVPGATQFDLPDVLGKPVLVVTPELPAGTLKDGESASFEIEFTVDYRGRVTTSRMASSSHPVFDAQILAQQREWMYAVATRTDLCATSRYRAKQRIEITRRDGQLVAPIEPAQVLEVYGRVENPQVNAREALNVPNYRRVMSGIPYPRGALVEGVEGRLALIIEFAADGTVSDAYPVNAAYDRWGFTNAALRAVRQLRADPPPGRNVRACVPVTFRVR